MENQELANYIAQRKAAGATTDAIHHELISAGWSGPDVAAALGEPKPTASPSQASPAPNPTQSDAPKLERTPVSSIAEARPVQQAAAKPQPMPSRPVQQPTAVTPPEETTISNVGARHGASRSLMLAIVAGAVLLIGGGSAAAYYSGALFTPSPTQLLSEGFAAMKAVTSASFAATSTISAVSTVPGVGSTTAHMQIALSGKADDSVKDNPAADVELSGAENTYADGGTTSSESFALHIMYVDKTLYLNIDNFNLQASVGSSAHMSPQEQMMIPAFIGMVNGAVSAVEHRWVEINLNSLGASSSTMAATTTPQVLSDVSALSSYFASGSYLDRAQLVGSESIQDVPTYHVEALLKFEPQLADLLKKLIMDQAAAAGTPGTSLPDLSTAFSGMVGKDVRVDLWIGKADKRFYQVAVAPMQLTDAVGGISVSATVAATTTFSGFDQPVSITAPSGAQTIQQVFQTLFGTVSGRVAQSGTPDVAVRADLTNLQAQAQLYASTNGGYGRDTHCATGMFTDTAIRSAIADIQGQGDTVSNGGLRCSANGTAYVVEAESPTQKGTYYCIDSTGAENTTAQKIVPGRTFKCP